MDDHLGFAVLDDDQRFPLFTERFEVPLELIMILGYFGLHEL